MLPGLFTSHKRGDSSIVLDKEVDGKQLTLTGDELFNAVGVSMGLLGVVVEVVFQCHPRFDIIGEEHIRPIKDYAGWIDFFGTGSDSLQNFLKETEYTRLSVVATERHGEDDGVEGAEDDGQGLQPAKHNGPQ